MASTTRARAPGPDFFGASAPALPAGFVYEPGFLTPAEEAALLAQLRELDFTPAKFQQYTARRRVVTYGASYDYGAQELQPAPPVPAFLKNLQRKIADWTGVAAADFACALINEYQPGTPLGWHRDRPEFEVVAGVSLGAHARMRLRRHPPGEREKSIALDLEPRSAYVMRDDARWKWQHAVSPTKALRYSITFRTLR